MILLLQARQIQDAHRRLLLRLVKLRLVPRKTRSPPLQYPSCWFPGIPGPFYGRHLVSTSSRFVYTFMKRERKEANLRGTRSSHGTKLRYHLITLSGARRHDYDRKLERGRREKACVYVPEDYLKHCYL